MKVTIQSTGHRPVMCSLMGRFSEGGRGVFRRVWCRYSRRFRNKSTIHAIQSFGWGSDGLVHGVSSRDIQTGQIAFADFAGDDLPGRQA